MNGPETTQRSLPISPRSGECENCHRERDDLFWHRQDEALYCADVQACEARFTIRAARGDFNGWPDAIKSGAHVRRRAAGLVG